MTSRFIDRSSISDLHQPVFRSSLECVYFFPVEVKCIRFHRKINMLEIFKNVKYIYISRETVCVFNRNQLIISQTSFSIEVLWITNTYSTLYLFYKNVNDISSNKESEVLTCLV